MRTSPTKFLSEPFRFDGRIDKTLLASFLSINFIVLVNAILHTPTIGYDADAHINYIKVLSLGRLPSPKESFEFFVAPLPYALPALLWSLGVHRFGAVLKFAQLLNVAYSIGLTFFLVRLCRAARSSNRSFAIWSLLLLGMLPVYYRTFAYLRGEPLAAFLAVFCVERVATFFGEKPVRQTQLLALGVSLGLLILAKQSGVFVLAAVLLFIVLQGLADPQRQKRNLQAAAVLVMLVLAIGGWFYLSLYRRFGSVAAFNEPPSPRWSLANRPREFYFGLGLEKLFTDPVRDSFSQFIPIFYADVWGDYWCYWVVRGRDPVTGDWVRGDQLMILASESPQSTNRYLINSYLGRVNILAVVPTLLYLSGVLIGLLSLLHFVRRPYAYDRILAVESLLGLALGLSVFGYFVLLVRYPLLDVKASYLLQAFPFAAILASSALSRLRARAPRADLTIRILLLLCALYSSPLFITRYFWRPAAWGARGESASSAVQFHRLTGGDRLPRRQCHAQTLGPIT